MKLPALSSLLLALACAGCIRTQVITPEFTFTTTRFLWNGKIGEASVSTNGTVTLREYRSEGEKLVEAAARGAASGFKP